MVCTYFFSGFFKFHDLVAHIDEVKKRTFFFRQMERFRTRDKKRGTFDAPYCRYIILYYIINNNRHFNS